MVYDDLVETVFAGKIISTSTSDALFNQLFENTREEYAPVEYDESGRIQYEPPPLDDIWLSEGERREKRLTFKEYK